jgi:hypothetical protein
MLFVMVPVALEIIEVRRRRMDGKSDPECGGGPFFWL